MHVINNDYTGSRHALSNIDQGKDAYSVYVHVSFFM